MSRTASELAPASLRAEEFAGLGDAVYLNAASVGPLPRRARAAVDAYQARRSAPQLMEEADFSAPLRRCREAAARLIGAEPAEIALGGNTSYGINLAALGLPLPRGSVILSSEGEFPANVYPWMAQRSRGVELELVPLDARGWVDEERLLERLSAGGVALLALSHVQFDTGYRADLARLGTACRDAGAFFVVDAIQSVGCLPVDVRAMEIDVLATGGHKWLCGPFGTGFAYVRRELHERLEPRVIGWTAMQACRDISDLTRYAWGFVDDARRYEVATPPFHDFEGLAASLELLLEVGVDRIAAHVTALLEPVAAWLAERPGLELGSPTAAGARSGILSFRGAAAPAAYEALTSAGVTCALREGAVRLSPHLYNTADEMSRVLEALSAREWS